MEGYSLGACGAKGIAVQKELQGCSTLQQNETLVHVLAHMPRLGLAI